MHATSIPLSLYLSNSSPSSLLMDSAFLLDGDARANLLELIAQSFGCRYVCLWSYLSPTSCLCYLDGLFHEDAGGGNGSNIQPRRLFDEYRQSLFILHQNSNHTQVPGLAFRNSSPYLEFREEDLLRLASNSCQRQFYQEASIKIAIFMGCRSGEIELGFSNIPQVNIEMQMMNLFPEDFSRHIAMRGLAQATEPNTTAMTNPPSSSSSSLRSLSMDSPEYSSLIFNIPTTTSSFINPELALIAPPIVESITTQALPIITTTGTPATASTSGTSPHPLQAMQEYARSLGNIQFPIIPESEHAAMTRAFLAVLSSPSSSSASSQQQQLQQQTNVENPRPTAFRRYSQTLLPRPQIKHGPQKHSMLKRAIAYCRSMNLMRIRDRLQGGIRPPSTTQLHHMMSERKRREKLNESFLALRSLLPPGTKKDKASLLATTREYLSSLKEQVEDLRRKNAILEAQVLPAKEPTTGEPSGSPSDGSRVEVRTRTVSESTSQDRTVDLQVTVRGECPALNLVIRILEFLKQVRNVSLMSMEADTQVHESNIVNRVNLRLNVEGGEWDESGFQEAVRRLVADLAQ